MSNNNTDQMRKSMPGGDSINLKMILIMYCTFMVFLIATVIYSGDFGSTFFLIRDEMPIVGVQMMISSICLLRLNKSCGAFDFPMPVLIAIVIGAISLTYFGHIYILGGYNCVIDEQLADFDAFIYRHGRLVWPLPAAWQGDASALNLAFMLPISKPVAWVSSYLPMNAALRAIVGSVADPALTGPILTGLSFPLLWACGRRLWPADKEALVVALLLLACSGQVLMMGMTAYAMPAHLFFNLLWLWFFLTDRVRTDLAALLVGFVATGLHQPLFHPLFATPFMILLLIERRWARLAIFVIGYAIISVFWIAWPHIIHGLVSGPQSITASGGVDYRSRLIGALSQNNRNLPFMAENMLRFFAWQHMLLLPLMLASLRTIRRNREAGALALGFVLPIAVMGIILPWQGFGFGYRYLHGVIGNSVLLGGYGWRQLAGLREQLRPYLLRTSAAGLFVILPMHAWLAHEAYSPFARLNKQIDESDAGYVIIGGNDVIGAGSLVRNRPDLSNRPIRLLADGISDFGELSKRICQRGAIVALPTDSFFKPVADYFNVGLLHYSSSRASALADLFQANGCEVSVLR